MFIHKLAESQSKNIGKDTSIWQFVIVLPNAKIGTNCNICSHVLIENDVSIGNNVTIKSGVQLWDGITIADDVFIGPNVTFTNDLVPRSKNHPKEFLRTTIKRGASVGANATIIGGITLGFYSFVGAGSVVTKNIEDFSVCYGNPAIKKGYITRQGELLDLFMKNKQGKQFSIIKNDLIPND
jgi:UDP-2-acetamido-3-amino-2,3-dideoxy-glucuronate N-acetyltransferase